MKCRRYKIRAEVNEKYQVPSIIVRNIYVLLATVTEKWKNEGKASANLLEYLSPIRLMF